MTERIKVNLSNGIANAWEKLALKGPPFPTRETMQKAVRAAVEIAELVEEKELEKLRRN